MKALFLYRIAHWCHDRGVPLVPRLIHVFNQIVFHCVIPAGARIGAGTELGYGGLGIILHERVLIGQRVMVGPQVTIGGRSGHYQVPIIEDDVSIGTGAKVLGPIRVGRGAVVGANAVVISDVPAGAVVGGVPARVLKYRSNAVPA